MNPFIFSNIEHIALLGASSLFKPLLRWGADNGVKVTIITSPDQATQIADLEPIVTETLTEDLRPHLKRLAFAISFGARWIMKQPIRQALFYDQVINCHGTRLPFDKGGGSWSYRVMRSDRIGSLTLHQVDDGIDTGPILAQRSYVIPRECQTPAQISRDYTERLLPFLIDFMRPGLNGFVSIEPQATPDYVGSYYPRLDTNTNGWIDWSLDPVELERFILAFDEPYQGALTNWNGTEVHLCRCQLHGGEARVNQWQVGTVIRKHDGFAVVALRDGWALVVENIRDASGADLMPRLNEGDRFSSMARIDRVRIGAKLRS